MIVECEWNILVSINPFPMIIKDAWNPSFCDNSMIKLCVADKGYFCIYFISWCLVFCLVYHQFWTLLRVFYRVGDVRVDGSKLGAQRSKKKQFWAKQDSMLRHEEIAVKFQRPICRSMNKTCRIMIRRCKKRKFKSCRSMTNPCRGITRFNSLVIFGN